MKFRDGYMISAGAPVQEYIDAASRSVMMRQGILGVKVGLILHTWRSVVVVNVVVLRWNSAVKKPRNRSSS